VFVTVAEDQNVAVRVEVYVNASVIVIVDVPFSVADEVGVRGVTLPVGALVAVPVVVGVNRSVEVTEIVPVAVFVCEGKTGCDSRGFPG